MLNQKLLVLFTVLIVLVSFNESKSNAEVFIYNMSYTDEIRVNVYPVGAVFNGFKRYSLQCRFPRNETPPLPSYIYIYGGAKELPVRTTSVAQYLGLNHDIDAAVAQTEGAVGYGKYRVDFYKKNTNSQYEFVEYCFFDYSDSDFDDFPF